MFGKAVGYVLPLPVVLLISFAFSSAAWPASKYQISMGENLVEDILC